MDPNANLEEQRRIVAWFTMYDDRDECLDEATQTFLQEYQQKAARLSELVHALDEWLMRGGAPPSAWVRK